MWDKAVEMTADGKGFTIDGKLVTFSSEADFKKVDWKERGVQLAMECTGKFLKVAELEAYFATCGVDRVVVSALVKDGRAARPGGRRQRRARPAATRGLP